jgi:hypothetical protein
MDQQNEGTKSIYAVTSHLETHTEPFLHGFQSQHRKDAREIKLYGETKKEFAKREFLKKEERGMARLGWRPGDLYEIKMAVIEEDLMIVQRMEEDLDRERMNRSTSSVDTATTDVSSVFDNEEDNDNDTANDEDDEEYDHIYSFDDDKPECRTDTDATICESAKEQAQSTEVSEAITEPTEEYLAFAAQEILRINNTLSAENFYSVRKPLLDERFEEFQQQSRGTAGKVFGGPNTKYHHNSIIDADLGPMASPSPLLASFCYKHCTQDVSDSDNENDSESDNDSDENDNWSTSCPNSPSPPTSLFYDAASIITNSYEETREPLPSPARQRKAKFLADLLAVRAQAEIDIEEDWEFKVWSKEERMQEKSRNAWEHSCYLKVELRLGGSPNVQNG